MIEALWSVEFKSNMQSLGSGVVVIETGRVLGGDAGFLYVGNVKVVNEIVHVNIKVTRYSTVLGLPSIFGNWNEFHIEATGPLNSTNILFQGHVVENPELKITVQATRRAELP